MPEKAAGGPAGAAAANILGFCWLFLWAGAVLIHLLGDEIVVYAGGRPSILFLRPTSIIFAQEAGRAERPADSGAAVEDNYILNRVGDSLLLLAAALIAAALCNLCAVEALLDRKRMLLTLTVSMITLALVKWLLVSPAFYDAGAERYVAYLLPLSLAPLLTVILLGPLAAVAVGFWTSLAAAVYGAGSLLVFLEGIAATVVAARMGRNVRTRKRILKIGVAAGSAMAACALSAAFVLGTPWLVAARQAAVAIANGAVTALFALLLLPLLEMAFVIFTDITLLEYCDMQHPLLKRLAIEAPGTYHHSLIVANLAEAAADAIGLNTLLVRVSAYFHDIGKLVKPGFYVENIQFSDNPHDNLSPTMSTLVIISHVKEGISLALTHKLPRPVVDAVMQHHGTGLVSYFYHKGAQQGADASGAESRTPLEPEQFRYPGPKPQTREIAVLSLADAIEAASRSLEKVTPGNIEKLIKDIVESKLKDGQLDECALTLAELNAVKKSFAFALVNMLHSRISYPTDANLDKQSAAKAEPEK